MTKKSLNHFYKKTHSEKINALKKAGVISEHEHTQLIKKKIQLPPTIATRMIENYILNYELPFGLAMNFLIDGREVVIPMVTEEPSVIAAASNAGKLAQKMGGFKTNINKRHVIGQIVLKEVSKPDEAMQIVKSKEKEIIDQANLAHPSILTYGGGAQRIDIRVIPTDPAINNPEFFIIHLIVDTAEAMGANIVNTMTESIAPYIIDLIGGSSLMNILSNYATESIVQATCTINSDDLATREMSGEVVRDRIIEASQLAQVDEYRAVTHNKGIMNGIDALLVATGNDWRAVEASTHAYAAKNGTYQSLSRWSKDSNGNLKGEIKLPIAVGSVGGTLSVHPTAQLAHKILDNPSAKELSQILAALGLAQNLAALKALVTDGIQKGHMSLQARALAIRVGAKNDQIDAVVSELQKAEHMNSKTAKKILNRLLK